MASTKPFVIAKRAVWEAYQQVKANRGLLLKAVRAHIKERWILLYLERWLTAPFETTEGEQMPRQRGTPQGGVVSPILMNLFMHYTFDLCMQRKYSQCRFCRYANDSELQRSQRAHTRAVLLRC